MRKLSILLIVLLAILSCARKEEKIAGEQGGTMVIGSLEEPASLSPLRPSLTGSNEILDLIYLHLHSVDPMTGEIKPQLATSWEYSEDLMSITYYLRKNAKWWDGTSVTAGDILFTFNKMKDPQSNYPNLARLQQIEKAELVDPYTIRFTFTKVYGDQLLDSDILPMPAHILEKEPDLDKFGQNPIGCGPYKLKQWVRGSTMEFVHNPDFYRGRPPLDQINIFFYTSLETMAKDFEEGKLDMIFGITPSIAEKWEKNQNVIIYTNPGNSYIYIGWNLNNPALKNLEVRKALSMGIDTDAMLKDLFLNKGVVSTGPLTPSSWAYNSDIQRVVYNPITSRENLMKAGFTDANRDNTYEYGGKPFELSLITNKENTLRVAIANRIAADLGKIGIKVKVQALDLNTFINTILSGRFDGYVMGSRIGQKIDPSIYWYSESKRGRYNLVAYENKTTDSLIDEGLVALSRKRAKEIWHKFQEIIYNDQPFTFLVVPNEISATYKRVRGVATEGISITGAYVCWIPEAERRPIAVAVAPTPPTPVTTTTTTEERPRPTPTTTTTRPRETTPPPIVEPERILEARARAETTAAKPAVDTAKVVPPPTMPKPSIITQAQVLKAVAARYPQRAREFGAEGRVVIRVTIGANGKVAKAEIASSFGNADCDDAALEAAKKFEFKPATKDGQPIEGTALLPFNFKP